MPAQRPLGLKAWVIFFLFPIKLRRKQCVASPVSSEKFQHLPLGRPHPGESSVAYHSGGQAGDTEFSLAFHLSQVPPTGLEGMKKKERTHKHTNIPTSHHSFSAPKTLAISLVLDLFFFFFLIFKYLFICLHRDLVAAHDLLSSCSAWGSLVVVLKLSCPETQGILVP